MERNTLHLRAPGNWLNDPNGFIYYQGKYHLFYQHFPYAPVWGTMHWGHAVSEDLLHWEHQGIALFPTKGYEQNGIFSGSAIEKQGELYLYYTGIRYLKINEENIHMAEEDEREACQALITSKDGFHFDNWNKKKQVLSVLYEEHEKASGQREKQRVDTRDPKVWEDKGMYFMVLGSTAGEKAGRVFFYQSEDGEHWRYASEFQSEAFGRFLECPDLFQVNGTYLLTGSAMFFREEEQDYKHHAICMVAAFDTDTCQLALKGKVQYMDYGGDLYAAQSTLDAEGRRTMVAWMRMPEMVQEEGSTAWRGMMCLPRLVEVREHHICFPVHPNVAHYFSKRVETIDFDKPYCLKLKLEEEELDIGGFKIQNKDNCVCTDRSRVFRNTKGLPLQCRTPRIEGEVFLEIFVDKHIIEIFVNKGVYVISNVVYGLGEALHGPAVEMWQAE